MFCMLLRKHLTGGRILEIVQPPMERLLDFRLETVDELGDKVERRLILECMGRRANLILLDGAGRIVDCLRRVDGDLAANRRQVLPGCSTACPLRRTSRTRWPVRRRNCTRRSGIRWARVWTSFCWIPLPGYLLSSPGNWLSGPGEDPAALGTELDKLLETVRDKRFAPYLLVREGKPVDFTFLPILQVWAGD